MKSKGTHGTRNQLLISNGNIHFTSSKYPREKEKSKSWPSTCGFLQVTINIRRNDESNLNLTNMSNENVAEERPRAAGAYAPVLEVWRGRARRKACASKIVSKKNKYDGAH